jgi:hypothetical protein
MTQGLSVSGLEEANIVLVSVLLNYGFQFVDPSSNQC